jgi:hypothetical protein
MRCFKDRLLPTLNYFPCASKQFELNARVKIKIEHYSFEHTETINLEGEKDVNR